MKRDVTFFNILLIDCLGFVFPLEWIDFFLVL